MTLPECELTGCTGHLGKFSSCLDEALYMMTGDGSGDATGTVEFQGHYTMLVLTEDEAFLFPDNRREVAVPAGNYVVREDDRGFISVTRHETEDAAREEWKAAEAAYSEWLGDDDTHSSTCTGCVHDCPWTRTCPPPMGAPFCVVCDDHAEAGAASEEWDDVDAYV